MQKFTAVFVGMALMLALAACSSPSEAGETAEIAMPGEGDAASIRPAFVEGELPLATQLALGTFELEGTEYALDAEQATVLLPLWKAYRSLANSDTAAAAELDALVEQIRNELTTAQLEFLTSQDYSPESMTTLMEKLGVTLGGLGAEGSQPEGFTPGAGLPGGGIPGGGLGRGQGTGPGEFAGQDLGSEQRATLEAMRESRSGVNNRFLSFLLDPLIEVLEEIASGG